MSADLIKRLEGIAYEKGYSSFESGCASCGAEAALVTEVSDALASLLSQRDALLAALTPNLLSDIAEALEFDPRHEPRYRALRDIAEMQRAALTASKATGERT
jgi:hypothetical protein